MRKSLFGYKIKETDNLFNSMQNHIDVLTGKITGLNAELAAKRDSVIDVEKYEQKVAQLKEKLASLENENADLKKQFEEIQSVKKSEEPKVENKAEYIGKIYMTAYEDAEKIKKNATYEVEEYKKQIENVKSEAKQKLESVLSGVREKQNNMESLLKESIKQIAATLNEFGLQSDEIYEKIQELEESNTLEASKSEQ